MSGRTIKPVHLRYPTMQGIKPHIIAGPCSVESRQQLKSVVTALSSLPQVTFIRCGVWKPRTRPGGFEGLGEQALLWMQELKPLLPSGVGFACEVARPEHVALAIKYGVAGLWIGARTTANPFMMSELTESLRGVNVPIGVKNAPNPDVRLWVGAIERCHQVGLSHITAIHRGFDILNNGGYRNHPLWEVPMELRRLMPEVPIFCDPSHIAGRVDPIHSISQAALDLGFDGLMLEVHPSPSDALTDAIQQITPTQLSALLDSLVPRRTESSVADDSLRLMRQQIDEIDSQILQLLASRVELCKQIAEIKARGNLAVYQPKRWESLLQQRLSNAQELSLNIDFVKEIFDKIHAESVRVQQEIIDK